jgi:hypothetical protein
VAIAAEELEAGEGAEAAAARSRLDAAGFTGRPHRERGTPAGYDAHGRRIYRKTGTKNAAQEQALDDLARERSLRGRATSAAKGAGRASVKAGGAAVRTGGRAAVSATKIGGGGLATRIIIAFGAFLIALEIASYLSGHYFSYDLKQGVQKLGQTGTYLGLYPGQQAHLATLQNTAAAGPSGSPPAHAAAFGGQLA